MKNLQLAEKLSIIFIFIISTISCKKEPDGYKDIDLSDANVRVVRVEQLREMKYQPFNFGKYIFTYNYTDNEVEVNFECNNPSYNNGYVINTHENGTKSIYYGDIRNHYFSPLNPSGVWYPYSSSYIMAGDRLFKIYDTMWSVISPITWQTEKGQFRRVEYEYNSFNAPLSITGYYGTTDIERWSNGTAFKIFINEYENEKIKRYTVKRYIQPNGISKLYEIYAGMTGLFVNQETIANNFDVMVTYQDAKGVPAILVSMLNNAILDLFPQVTSDYIFNYITDMSYESKVRSTFFPELPETAPNFADWIIGLCTNDINILPKQNQLVYSKRVKGVKLYDIVDGEAVFTNIDSIATFPYTHDPVAKTLEIAGLKIWYEVVD
jgi:hypothetical protein